MSTESMRRGAAEANAESDHAALLAAINRRPTTEAGPEPALPVAWRWSALHSEAPEDRAWKDGMPPERVHDSRIEVAYAPGSTPWRSMDSAPLDGTEVLIRVKTRAGMHGKCLVGHFIPGGYCIEDHPAVDRGWFFWNGCMFDKAAEPESWLPLPDAAPQAKPPKPDEPIAASLIEEIDYWLAAPTDREWKADIPVRDRMERLTVLLRDLRFFVTHHSVVPQANDAELKKEAADLLATLGRLCATQGGQLLKDAARDATKMASVLMKVAPAKPAPAQPFVAGQPVRQYHSADRIGFTDAHVLYAHPNGALDVIAFNGTRYGWTASLCEPLAARRVVCAAIRAADGRLVLGIRHYSTDMREQIARRDDRLRFEHLHDPDQGFVDQFGVYMTREEAYQVAQAAGQIIRPEACGQGLDGPKLYSEGLY